MILAVYRPKILAIDVSVDLRGRDVRVPKHFLDRPQVGASLQQVGCKRVSERVGRHVLFNSRAFDVLPEDLPGTHARERLPPDIEKERSTPFPVLEPRSQLPNVRCERSDRSA